MKQTKKRIMYLILRLHFNNQVCPRDQICSITQINSNLISMSRSCYRASNKIILLSKPCKELYLVQVNLLKVCSLLSSTSSSMNTQMIKYRKLSLYSATTSSPLRIFGSKRLLNPLFLTVQIFMLTSTHRLLNNSISNN